jgi:hypothetical protein
MRISDQAGSTMNLHVRGESFNTPHVTSKMAAPESYLFSYFDPKLANFERLTRQHRKKESMIKKQYDIKSNDKIKRRSKPYKDRAEEQMGEKKRQKIREKEERRQKLVKASLLALNDPEITPRHPPSSTYYQFQTFHIRNVPRPINLIDMQHLWLSSGGIVASITPKISHQPTTRRVSPPNLGSHIYHPVLIHLSISSHFCLSVSSARVFAWDLLHDFTSAYNLRQFDEKRMVDEGKTWWQAICSLPSKWQDVAWCYVADGSGYTFDRERFVEGKEVVEKRWAEEVEFEDDELVERIGGYEHV